VLVLQPHRFKHQHLRDPAVFNCYEPTSAASLDITSSALERLQPQLLTITHEYGLPAYPMASA
jgi:hypothetical protein